MRLNLTRRDLTFLVGAGLLVLLYVQSAGAGFPLDDSWIHQTFARNLATHGEWSFIPGQPSAASTSPLYTLLLSAGYLLRVDYVLWTHALGALVLAVAASLAARLGDLLLPRLAYAGWLSGLAILFCWHLIWAAASGMETMLAAMWTLALIWLVLRHSQPDVQPWRGLWLGCLTGLAALTRPELILLGGLAALAISAEAWRRPRWLLIYGICAAFAFAMLIAPYLYFNLQVTGGLLPNTAAAKFEQHAVLLALPLSQRFGDLLLAISVGGQFLLLPGVLIFIWRSLRGGEMQRLRASALLWIWPLALLLLYALRLPAAYQHGRYVMPALPALVLAGTLGTLWLMQRTRRSMLGRVLVRTLAVSAALTLLFFAFGLGRDAYRDDVAIINEEMVAAATWIQANLPVDELLAIHDVGAVGYFAPRPALLDIAGLVSPELIPIVADGDALWQTMEARGARYLMAFPDQIPGRNPQDARLCLLYRSSGATSARIGGPAMAVYRLVFAGACPEDAGAS